jgi:glycine reductase
MGKLRVVHYINQFYGGVGGEDKADFKPELREGHVGPGQALSQQFGDKAQIVATVVCGDSYFNENVDQALGEILPMIEKHKPDVFVAGPAFNAGRYGMACGAVSKAVHEKFNIPVVTAMYGENPGVDSFKKDVYILQSGNSAADMRNTAPKLAAFTLKLGKKETIGKAADEGYFSRGIRKNVFVEERGSKRAVDMLIKKIKGEAFETEYPMPVFDTVPPNPAIKDLSKAKIALVTSGGIVPKNNPDKIESSSASKYGKYDIDGCMDLTDTGYETAHGGYDPVYANQDSDRVLPVDVLRDMEKEGLIGGLHRYFYTTVGNGTSVANSKAFASQIAGELKNDGIQAVILTST